ncbi:hypothetical protein TWF106_001035 [Orbilia oligospora]|uniref:Uncharacterized protein n=1 Tax=Orbilia oligospora TaxID=2813651 RepID=A0A6G1LVX6_ORBOL|nr:hypothetical protein TWF106_001035 [Orbilia oligospora]KAF3226466.1 hypothetical protein TWF191_004728 [Orbilia oligospora]KAF3234583.1 hypothetical protein TWF192_001256 [Orbilia oligospora]
MHPLVKDGVSAAFATIIITVFLEAALRFRFNDSKSRAGYRRWIVSVLASIRLSVSALPGATSTGDVNSPTNQPTSLPSTPYEISSSIVYLRIWLLKHQSLQSRRYSHAVSIRRF